MTHPDIQKIQQALDAGHKKTASELVKDHLRNDPTADGWYLAATMTSNRDSKIKYLRKALELDEWHTQANRLLHKVEGKAPENPITFETEWNKKTGEKPVDEIERQNKSNDHQERKKRQRNLTRFGCMFSIMLSMITSTFTMRAVGMIPEFMGTINELIGEPTPVEEFNGVSLEESTDAIYRMQPVVEEVAQQQGVEIMDAGYLHEHTFNARQGEQYAVYVQFLSLSANRVSRNVLLLDPAGNDAQGQCIREQILEGDNNVAFICLIHMTGEWRLRILGRDNESVGAYFVGAQKLEQ